MNAPPTNVPAFNVYLGTELRRMERGEAEMTLELAPHHLNGRGVVHGGVLASLLDSALGAAVISSIPKEWWCATISLSVQFLEGARRGRLTAQARVIRRGGRVERHHRAHAVLAGHHPAGDGAGREVRDRRNPRPALAWLRTSRLRHRVATPGPLVAWYQSSRRVSTIEVASSANTASEPARSA